MIVDGVTTSPVYPTSDPPPINLGGMPETHLSPEAYERLKAELHDLTTRGRTEIARAIERARELGDLTENGDYHAAKDDQGKMEARIRQLQALLDRAVIVEGAEPGGKVATGSVVSIRYFGDDDTERYLVGSIEERRDDIAVISPGSPLGRALIGHEAGETVEYDAPSGTLRVEIVEVGA
jgi:transcription elongation factor GreA